MQCGMYLTCGPVCMCPGLVLRLVDAMETRVAEEAVKDRTRTALHTTLREMVSRAKRGEEKLAKERWAAKCAAAKQAEEERMSRMSPQEKFEEEDAWRRSNAEELKAARKALKQVRKRKAREFGIQLGRMYALLKLSHALYLSVSLVSTLSFFLSLLVCFCLSISSLSILCFLSVYTRTFFPLQDWLTKPSTYLRKLAWTNQRKQLKGRLLLRLLTLLLLLLR